MTPRRNYTEITDMKVRQIPETDEVEVTFLPMETVIVLTVEEAQQFCRDLEIAAAQLRARRQ